MAITKTGPYIAFKGNPSGNVDETNVEITPIRYIDSVADNNPKSIKDALDAKADLESPAFTGIPTAPTASEGTNSNQLATTKFVQTAVTNGHTSSADKLATPRELAVNLSNTSTTTKFDGSADVTGIKVSGVLDVAHGGTGHNTVTSNSYLKGNGTGALVERTYAQVRSDLGISAGANKVEASNSNGHIKIDGVDTTVYTHPTTDESAAAAVKVGKDGSGHVVLGSALTPSDVGAATSSHTHGNITNDGKVGTTADLPLKTTTGGSVAAGAWATSASAVGSSASAGTAVTFSRGDHTHSISVATGDAAGQVKIAGQNASVNGWSSKANLASPSFTGTPTAPTANVGTNTTQIATTAFVKAEIDSVLDAADAMQFKGTIGASGDSPDYTSLPNTHKSGWSYKVVTAGTYAGKPCEIGDMIICIKDGTAANNADWTVVQGNLDGAVTGPSSSVSEHIAVFNGTSGKIIKDSTYTIATSVPSNAVFTDTKVTSAANHYSPSTASGSDMSAAASAGSAAWSMDVVKGVTLNTDGKGHVTGLSVTSGKVPANPNTDITVKATAKTDNANYKILATASASPTSGAATEAVYDTDIALNPSTNTISANISGNAATASRVVKTLESSSSSTVADTNIMAVSGSSDGFNIDYGATTADAGVLKMYTTDDANAKISIGNKVSSTYNEAIAISNGSASLGGTPTAPTASTSTNNTQIATTKFVKDVVNTLDVTDIAGFGAGNTLATLTETDGKVSATFQQIKITKSQVTDFPSTMTPSSHTHGNINNDGKMTDTAAAAAGSDYVLIRDADNSKVQTSTIKGTDVADAVSKKHSHSTLTLSTTAQAYDGTNTLALPANDPYTSARTPASHTHGNINNGGAMTDTAAAAAGNDYVLIRDATDAKVQTSTIKGTDVADAVSKKHSHSTLTLSTTAQAYDGNHTLALPSSDPYTSARTPTSHAHGNVSNDGTLTDTAAAASGSDYLVIRDDTNNKIQTSTIKGTDVADAVSNKHSHSSLTLSKTAQKYDGSHTLALPASDPYTSARTPASHTHGNINNDGAMTDTAAAAAGNDYVLIRDADDAKVQTSTIKGTDVADAVSKKHSHSTLTLSTTAQAYDGTHTLALPTTDPYTSARTPSSHASSATTYGVGTTANYGHVKLATGDMNGATNTDGVAVSKNHTHSQYLPKSGGAMTGAITRDLGSGVISDTNLLTVTGSTDGFKVDYGAATSDVGVTKIYTTDDANAKISIGNYNSGYKEAIGITNGSAALSNTPTAPTAAAGTNTTQIATTAFVTNAVTNHDHYRLISVSASGITLPNYSESTVYRNVITSIGDFCRYILLYDISQFYDGTNVNSEHSCFYGDVSTMRLGGWHDGKFAKVYAGIGYGASSSGIRLYTDSDACKASIVKCSVEYVGSGWVDNKGIVLESVGSTVSLTPITASGVAYKIVDCSSYTKLYLNFGFYASDGTNQMVPTVKHLWAFVDSSNKIISECTISAAPYGENREIDVPSNAVKFICHTSTYYSAYSYVGVASAAPKYYLALRPSFAAGTVQLFGRFYTRMTATSTYNARPLLLTCISNIGAYNGSSAPCGWSIQTDGSYFVHASTADKLATARKLAVSLSNTSTDSTFDGSADQTAIKVSGTLGVGNGGTSITSNPSMLTNLGSTTAASVFAASPRPGVTGTLPLGNGGTGATTRLGALKSLTNEEVGANAQYFLTITTDWAKGGYSSVANVKTVLGLKGAAYLDTGTAAGTVATGNHGHGDITNDGKVGTTANLPLKTTTGGTVSTGAWATSASAVGSSASAGSAVTFSRGDHTHNISVATGDSAGQVKIAGQNASVNGWSTKANLASPAFTGTPTAPTAAAGTNTTQIATTAFVNTAYNFNGTTFYSGNSSNCEHNANNIKYNGVYYWTSNGPSVELGMTGSADGAIFAQAYSSTWVGQIAQDYRNGNLFTRGMNNGTWTSWLRIPTAASKSVGNSTTPVYMADSGQLTALSYTIAKSVPSDAVFTDTKVTSSANHYTPATASGSDKTASASGATAAWSIDVVKGVTLNTDGKGHVTGLSVTSGKIPANPNTDTKVIATAKTDNVNYKILATASASPTSGNATEAVYDTDITLNPSTNTIAANISGKAAYLAGTYSGNGGALAPSAITKGTVRAAMMNGPKGLTAFNTYCDCILMDTYTGSDVPYVTGLGISRNNGNPRMFIFNGAQGNTTTWAKELEVLTTGSTVAIANGGTGATTRLNALKNLTNEEVGANAQYFLTITTDWAKGGYSSVANVKTVLGLKGAAYLDTGTAAGTVATGDHKHGNITNGGLIEGDFATVANKDRLLISDFSADYKVARSNLEFDASTIYQVLTKKGTFENYYDAWLSWGGRHITGGFSPIDASLVSYLGANRLALIKAAAVSVEYTRDGGTTWTNYGSTDTEKRALFTTRTTIVVGKADSSNKATTEANYAKYKTRVTIDKANTSLYSELRKFVFYITTNGSSSCYVVISGVKKEATTDTWSTIDEMQLTGWSGYNVFNTSLIFGNSYNGQYKKLRFLFEARAAGSDTNYNGLAINSIYAYGGFGWGTDSTLALTDHLYSISGSGDATFPANVTATKFIGALQGNADTATTATKLGSDTKGSATKPIYLNSGTATECTTYAGGTAVTLNNASKAGSTASFYAPTAGGTANYVLIGNGTTSAPTWAEKAPKASVADSATTATHLVYTLAGSGTITDTNIVDVSGSTDGFKMVYGASTADAGHLKMYTIDDANAELSIGNLVSGTYKKAISVINGSATITGSLTGNASTATQASYPAGFNSRISSISWGTLTSANGYTYVTGWKTASNSEIAFAEKSNALYTQIDGVFYQREGGKRVLDESDINSSFYAPTAGGTANYVLIGNGTTSAPTWAEKAPKASAADSSINAEYPKGFTRRKTSISWGTLSNSQYTFVADWAIQGPSDSGDIAFAAKAGSGTNYELSCQIDGLFYQRTGNQRVLDESDIPNLGNEFRPVYISGKKFVACKTHRTVVAMSVIGTAFNTNDTSQEEIVADFIIVDNVNGNSLNIQRLVKGKVYGFMVCTPTGSTTEAKVRLIDVTSSGTSNFTVHGAGDYNNAPSIIIGGGSGNHSTVAHVCRSDTHVLWWFCGY